MNKFFSKDINECIKELKTNIDVGLTNNEAKNRLRENGYNKFISNKEKSIVKMILEQFKDFLIIILLISALLSIVLGKEYLDGIIIVSIVIINIVIGVIQENKANNALKVLKEMSSPQAKVKRGGIVEKINSDTLVIGDIIILDTGDYVPADIRLLETINLKIDESSLTGESISVDKKAEILLDENTSLGDRVNSAYMGTMVTYGRGVGIVCAIGMNTQMGGIANLLNESKDERTPLQIKLDELAKSLGTGCIAICILVFIFGLFNGMNVLEIFMISVSLAVAAIPEGLAIVVTIVLAIGVQRMVKSNSIIKKLSAVETLGSTNVICSDKTGTLTQNKMTVVKLFDIENIYNVTGRGYKSEGKIINSNLDKDSITDNIKNLIEGAVLCNNSSYSSVEEKIIGDPTEGALLVLGEKLGLNKKSLDDRYKRIREIPFDSERKLMSTYHKKDSKIIMYTKGAPDELLKRCTQIYIDGKIIRITDEYKEKILQANINFALEGLRVLCVAFRNFDEEFLIDEKEEDLIYLGLICMIDPPREEVKCAIEKCKKAGIIVKMITGDHKITARTIAKDLGIINEDENVLEGIEISRLSDEALKERVKNINVFARVSPEHKVRLVDAIKNNNNIVAMTGDGVNDAPSLKKADIGIAMGITGTDVSKEAADMILTDDNFVSIVKAVEEGRTIYNNIVKVVGYLLSCNIAEILIIFFAMLGRFLVPLVATQLLFINLFTDVFPAFALGMEQKEDDIMLKSPRDAKEAILGKRVWMSIMLKSILLSIGALGGFFYGLKFYEEDVAKTICFTTLVISELLISYVIRREKFVSLKKELFGNKYLNKCIILSLITLFAVIYIPFLNNIFKTTNLNVNQFVISLIFSLIPVLIIELFKIIFNKKTKIKSLTV